MGRTTCLFYVLILFSLGSAETRSPTEDAFESSSDAYSHQVVLGESVTYFTNLRPFAQS